MPFVSEDVVRFKPDNPAKKTFNLYWGSRVEVIGRVGSRTQLRVFDRDVRPIVGTVKGKLPTQDTRPLEFMMVDVQQGDGIAIVTPEGKKVLIDGGDNKLFARFLANRFRGTSKDAPLDIDAIIITHGDADHFEGLNLIRDSEREAMARKRLFIHPKRIIHNGLAKAPSSVGGVRTPDEEMFGPTKALSSGGLAITDLVDDITTLSDDRLNRPFTRWRASIRHWSKHGPISSERVEAGDRAAFRFLRSEGIDVEVLGPVTRTTAMNGKRRRVLHFLRTPVKDDNISIAENDMSGRAFSASHTINGHSVTLRITYGNVRFFLGGDLNQEAMAVMNSRHTPAELQSEVLKVPHHGSADFDLRLLKKISPVISLVSSGDESSRKEHIHPRATLMGALGRVARGNMSLVFATELAAFFEMKGMARTLDDGERFFGFERTNFGIVHIRTDGERLLVFTHSGKDSMNEAYRLHVDAAHKVTFAKSIKKR